MLTQNLFQQINIIHEFTVNRNNQAQRLQSIKKSSNKNTLRQRYSYIHEQKLNAITYYFNIKITNKRGKVKQISKYKIVKDSDFINFLLSKWIKQENLIRTIKKDIRKNQIRKKTQEEEIERRLYKIFTKKKRDIKRINRK
jgi:hypothetical protein